MPAPSLTWAPMRAPALDFLADEPAEQAGERAELGEVLHVVDGDVQGLGGQEPQLGFVSILHACRRVGGRVSSPSTLVCCTVRATGPLLVTQWAEGPSQGPQTPQAPERGHLARCP